MSGAPAHRGRFTLLEAGRGIAALMVVLHHAGNMVAQPRFFGVHPFGGHLRNFNVGVDFFFVLSGFIIAWVHWKDLGVPARLPNYAAKRFLRVYPPYWGILIPLTALYLIFPRAGVPSQHDPLNILLSVLLLPNFVQPVLGVAWTLTYEIFFYLLFAVAIAAGRRMLPLFALWAAAILIANLRAAPLPFPLSFLLNPVDLEFILGVGAAAWMRTRSVPRPGVILILGAAGFAALTLFATTIQDDPLAARLAFGLCALAMVLGGVGWERTRTVALPRALVLLGAASYSIYLVHPVALSFGAQGAVRLIGHRLPIEGIALLLALMGLVAGLLYHRFAEPRLTRWAERALGRRASAPRAAPAAVRADE